MPHLPYRELPDEHPGTPPRHSPQRYLAWLARRQISHLSWNAVFGVGWMVAQALVWAAVGRAIDAGIVHHDGRALAEWVGLVMVLGVFQAVCGSLRHQLAVTNWMHAAFRTSHLIGRHITATGEALTDEIPAGDVVNTVMFGLELSRTNRAKDSNLLMKSRAELCHKNIANRLKLVCVKP